MNAKLKQQYFNDDVSYYTKEMGLTGFDINQHNEDTLAQLVEDNYNKLDLNDVEDIKKTRYKWLISIGLLEVYLLHNYATFKRTELVYKWAKDVCDRRNDELNQYRMWGWTKGSFEVFAKINLN